MSKRLTRSKDKRMLTGVLGGVAEYFNADATIVRLIFVILAIITTGFPLSLLYIIAAVIIPNEGDVVS
ncbi:PspC domain-containing protein [Pontibacillus yanchengensis]|uniref:PspC family transcriptional regulator n=3 Tax=Pontibacillus yanchengensis TaxID=462910 RepID=A0A0A2THP8_9BACI|nr:PspC domain-containing protein [Pontibacillus yanchengensis]KGP73601.1 PspC family transcriptional regulator [Pontibacillus yanchengensis Y32]MYL34012.1 PspC domain-containing protein [Pontibacillus yanchengensis]MYL54062.1 PspC domain-containing protein [Pontibacillus yanchengensis]